MRHQQKNTEVAHVKKQMKEGNGGNKNNSKEDGFLREKNGSINCCVPFLKCARSGQPLPETLADGIKMSCTNEDCLVTKHLVHPECFRSMENSLWKVLNSSGYKYCKDKGVKLTQDKLWEPKGLALIQKNLKCECGKGVMSRDNEAWEKRMAIIEPPIEEKEKKKHKPAPKLPELQVCVKKGAPPPPNFHKLDTHYLSSHSPTRSKASFIEDKYGPPPPPAATVKTRRTSNNSITSIDTSVAAKPLPAAHSPTIKKPAVPIGYAPVELAFPKLVEEKLQTTQIKPPETKAVTVESKPKATSEPIPPPQQQWTTVIHPVKSKPIECNVEVQLKNHTVQSEYISHTVETNPIEVLETFVKEATPNLSSKIQPYSYSQSMPKKKYVSIEVQTDETSFDQSLTKEQWQWQRNYRPKDFVYDSDTTHSISPTRPGAAAAPLHLANSRNEFDSSRKSRLTTSSGFASISDADFSPYQTTSPNNEAAAIVSFLFKADETCAVEIYQNGRKEKVRNVFDNEWTPLFLSMAERSPEVGEKAQIHHLKFPKHVLYDIFKCIGKPVYEIRNDPRWDFKFIDSNGIKCFQIQTQNGLRAIPEDYVVAAFLKALKTRAEKYLNNEISEIYLSSNFDLTDPQKDVFKKAAAKVELSIVRFYVRDV